MYKYAVLQITNASDMAVLCATNEEYNLLWGGGAVGGGVITCMDGRQVIHCTVEYHTN